MILRFSHRSSQHVSLLDDQHEILHDNQQGNHSSSQLRSQRPGLLRSLQFNRLRSRHHSRSIILLFSHLRSLRIVHRINRLQDHRRNQEIGLHKFQSSALPPNQPSNHLFVQQDDLQCNRLLSRHLFQLTNPHISQQNFRQISLVCNRSKDQKVNHRVSLPHNPVGALQNIHLPNPFDIRVFNQLNSPQFVQLISLPHNLSSKDRRRNQVVFLQPILHNNQLCSPGQSQLSSLQIGHLYSRLIFPAISHQGTLHINRLNSHSDRHHGNRPSSQFVYQRNLRLHSLQSNQFESQVDGLPDSLLPNLHFYLRNNRFDDRLKIQASSL